MNTCPVPSQQTATDCRRRREEAKCRREEAKWAKGISTAVARFGTSPAHVNTSPPHVGAYRGDEVSARGRVPRSGGAGVPPSRPQGGFASVVVLILVFVMIALLLGNTRVLEALKRDLQRVEQRQLARPISDAPTIDQSKSPAPAAPALAGSHD